jgi:mono/diheme cytochrome c family protein
MLAIMLTACSGKTEVITPTVNCDTTATIKYSTDVVNILKGSCYVCHAGNAAAGAGYILDTYSGVSLMVNNELLLKSITHSPGASPMPKGAPKLSDCNIAKIRTWIRNGAPNN